jgi:glycosyltransferase involved in cell wall biosynthesis
MRIGIDARELCGHPTGVGRYLSGLLHEWAADERARRHEFVLYAHDPLDLELDTRRFALRVVPGRGGSRWEQHRLPQAMGRDHLDVFFSPGYTTPLLTRVPRVVAIHDVSFAAHPEWFKAREGLRQRYLSRRSARAAHAVITISEFSRGEIIEWLRVPADRVHVIPPGIADRHAGERTLAAPRLLYVGSIFNRRHLPDLIRAFSRVVQTHPDVSLDLVGDNRTFPHEPIADLIAAARLNGRARWHQYVSETELDHLYGGASAFAFLSEYEGLGLTPLEALSAGVPAVLLDTAVARESCGGAALYVRKGDIHGIAEAIARILFDPATRTSLLAAAPAVLQRYDWSRASAGTLQILERAA